MKITKVEAIVVGIPYEHGAPKPVMGTGQTRQTMDAVYVKVSTDEGLVGWGEAFGFAVCRTTAVVVSTILEPLTVGRDPIARDALMDDLARRTQSLGRTGPGAFALAGLDIALWDIAGKAAGAPIHRLLGGARKSVIPAYASVLKTGGDLGLVEKQIGRAIERRFGAMKLHERSTEAMAHARKLLGPNFYLAMDTNCAWTLDEATTACHALEPLGLAWVEEPTYPADDYATMAELRRRTSVPIGAGELMATLKEARGQMEAGAVDIFQPDVTRMGGLTGAWRALQLAAELGVRGDPHSPYYGPGLIASLHLAAVLEEDVRCEHFFSDLEASPLGEAVVPVDGLFRVPTGPGLGVEVDEAVLARYRVA
jgi:D-galactarolactone cycloisomerase